MACVSKQSTVKVKLWIIDALVDLIDFFNGRILSEVMNLKRTDKPLTFVFSAIYYSLDYIVSGPLLWRQLLELHTIAVFIAT